jgi:hypothetical protein
MAIGSLNVRAYLAVSVREKQNRKPLLIYKEAIDGYIMSLEEDGLPVPEEHFEALMTAI